METIDKERHMLAWLRHKLFSTEFIAIWDLNGNKKLYKVNYDAVMERHYVNYPCNNALSCWHTLILNREEPGYLHTIITGHKIEGIYYTWIYANPKIKECNG